MNVPNCRCDNCGFTCHESKLIWPIPDLDERLDPGGVVPAGECPQCGALSYLITQENR